jgi:signal transduction histidine kinase
LGILTTLDWHCREFQKTFAHIRIEKEMDISENDVPPSLKTVIYRISQEALNNIAKHSKADLITLSLRKNDGPIELTVQDNGQGFDMERIFSVKSDRKGLGLGSMRERAELSGGTFTIESILGKGTTIRASWPAA